MDTLIVFSSKYGAAKKSAEYLNEKLKGSLLIDLSQNEPNVESFKNIIVGGSVYGGKLSPRISKFLKNNRKLLKKKNLRIWVNCLTRQSFNEIIANEIPQELRKSAGDIVFAGGILPESVSLADRIRFLPMQKRIAGLPAFDIDWNALDGISLEDCESGDGETA